MDTSSDSERENRAQLRRMARIYRSERRRPYEYARFIPRLVNEFFTGDDTFIARFGIDPVEFEELHSMVGRKIQRYHTKFRDNIGSRERLALCLRYLASGKSVKRLSQYYRIPPNTIPIIIREVCKTIYRRLMPLTMPVPTKRMWEKKAQDFKDRYEMPNCIGALEGKNLLVDGKKIVLLAIVDARERFVMVDVGYYRRNRFRSNVMDKSKIGKQFLKKQLNVPPNKPITEGSEPVPFMLLASSLFPLKPYVMTKYSKAECAINDTNKVFNTRVSRAKLIANRVLMRLRLKWGVFHGPLKVHPSVVESIVLSCCCLYNFFGLRMRKRKIPRFPNSVVAITDERLEQLINLVPTDSNDTRNQFKKYFLSTEGQVPWQWQDVV